MEEAADLALLIGLLLPPLLATMALLRRAEARRSRVEVRGAARRRVSVRERVRACLCAQWVRAWVIAAVTAGGMGGASAKGLALWTWDEPAAKAEGSAAEQVQSVLWTLMPKVGSWAPASFTPVEDPAAAEVASKAIDEAWAFVLADANGARTPESMEHASSAFFTAKKALGVLRPPDVARAAFLLAVPTARTGQEELALEYVTAAIHADAAVATHAPKFGVEFERLVAKAVSANDLARPADAKLVIEPAGAVILLNGVPLAIGAESVSAKPGLHLIQATAIGYYPLGWLVDVGGRADLQKLSLKSHPSRTRWEAAEKALKAANATDAGLAEPPSWRDLLRLSSADVVLALRVSGTDSVFELWGGAGTVAGWRPIRATVPKSVEALQGFEKLLRDALPGGGGGR